VRANDLQSNYTNIIDIIYDIKQFKNNDDHWIIIQKAVKVLMKTKYSLSKKWSIRFTMKHAIKLNIFAIEYFDSEK